MKFTVERATLYKSLSHVQNVVERHHPNPLLSNVKIKAADGALVLNATDNELEVAEKLPATVDVAGEITVPAHKLYEITGKLPDGAEILFDLNTENNVLKITTGRTKFTLSTLPGEDFPSISEGDMTHTFELEASVLRDLVDRTAFAASTEETRYYLNGIYFHEATSKDEKILRAVATDGHRLACAEAAFPENAAGMPGVIIPRKAISELSKLLSTATQTVKIELSTYKIRFTIGDLVLTSLLIEGTYPDYERVIPADNDKVLEVDAMSLASVVDRVSSLSEKSKAVRLAMSDGLVKVTAASTDEGSAEDEIEVKYTAEPIEIGFNYVYLCNVLKQIKGGLVQISFLDSSSPTILTDMSDPSVLYVLMPMRV